MCNKQCISETRWAAGKKSVKAKHGISARSQADPSMDCRWALPCESDVVFLVVTKTGKYHCCENLIFLVIRLLSVLLVSQKHVLKHHKVQHVTPVDF